MSEGLALLLLIGAICLVCTSEVFASKTEVDASDEANPPVGGNGDFSNHAQHNEEIPYSSSHYIIRPGKINIWSRHDDGFGD